MGWIHDEHDTSPDRYVYTLKETLLRPLVDGEVVQALDAWPVHQSVEGLAEYTPDPAINYRVWRDGKEVPASEAGDVVSHRTLLRRYQMAPISMAPGVILAPGVVLFRRFLWDWECVLPTGVIKTDYHVTVKHPVPLSLVEFVHHEAGLAHAAPGCEQVVAPHRYAIGSFHADVEVRLRNGGSRNLARVCVATDADGSRRLYVKAHTHPAYMDAARRKVGELAAREEWSYSTSSMFAQWLRGERQDAGDQDGVYANWSRGGETIFGYTGDEIRLP